MDCSDVLFLLLDVLKKGIDKYLPGIIYITSIDRKITFSVTFYNYDLYVSK